MTEKFPVFAHAVRAQFDRMAKGRLYEVDTDRDLIWTAYLGAFPEGTNPIFRERTEHDCSCCRGFIRNVGNVVAIKDDAMVTVWDVTGLPEPYQTVADTMAAYIRGIAIRDVYFTKQARQGTAKSVELTDEGRTLTWNHFSVDVPNTFLAGRKSVEELQGDKRTTFQVLKRGLTELKYDAVATVVDLIEQNALYRGQEHMRAVKAFRELQFKVFGINDPLKRDLVIWQMIDEPVARFRNTVIGTLVQDLSDGKDLEDAVRIFESKVAPQNYKRPTALITKAMVEAATKTIAELGLEEALERRHARFSDVSVTSVLFVDNAVQGEMKGGLKNLLMEEVKPAPFDPKKAEEISITDFVSKLPAFTSLKVYLENAHMGNFMSLTAPVHEDTKGLFKWNNDFAWSYEGNVTDSIKERVKRAGGRVENVALRVSLAWYNTDDLDLHCKDPAGRHIYFANKCDTLDVDMNAGHYAHSRTPVENMRWVNLTRDGVYQFEVNQFNRRESLNIGFEVEIETAGGITNLQYTKAAQHMQPVVEITVKGGAVVAIQPAKGILGSGRSQEKWGLKTQDLVRVNSVVLSPNHWDDNMVGNKHWFFILDGCKNPEPTRGLYNEFLSAKLEKHRKVFEVLGDKTKCPPAAEQMSGLGFSSTRQDKVTVVAAGPKVNKIYTVVFG